MNAVTPEFIANVGRQVHPGTKFHPSTLTYIATLLTPYADSINMATVPQVLDWIPRAFPGELAKHALSEATKADTKKKQELKIDTDTEEVSKAVRTAVIEYIIAEITELSGNVAADHVDSTVLPWDAQTAIGYDTELSKMFGITATDKQLPVTITIDGQLFTHMLTREFAAGLLLFSAPSVANHDFNITIFGQRWDPSYIDQAAKRNMWDIDLSRFEVGLKNGYQYELEVIGTVEPYWFNTTDFMQGFATGAQWLGVDHHHYWRRLVQHDPNGSETEITF